MQTVIRFKLRTTGQLAEEIQLIVKRGFKVVTMSMNVKENVADINPDPVEAVVVFEPEMQDFKSIKNFESEEV